MVKEVMGYVVKDVVEDVFVEYICSDELVLVEYSMC